jgi:hypothetical protein
MLIDKMTVAQLVKKNHCFCGPPKVRGDFHTNLPLVSILSQINPNLEVNLSLSLIKHHAKIGVN